MKYTIRWLEDGISQEAERDDKWSAVLLAVRLERWCVGVEVLDETGRLVWPFRPEDADICD